MNALFSARRGFPRSLLCSFMLPALAAYAGSARALECVGVVRPDGTVEWDDQYKSRPLRIAEHGSRCVDEGTNAMARGDGPVALERLEEAFRYLTVTPVRETETGAEAWTRLRESSFRFGCRMVDAATNALAQGRQAEADDAFAAARRFLALCRTVDVVTDAMAQGKQEKDAFIDARRFLAVCRDSGEDDVRPPTLIANLDTRLLLDSIVSSFSVDSTTNAIDVELADYELADYWPRRHPWPRWEGPDVGDPLREPHGEEVETLRSSFRLSAGRRVCFGDYVFGFSFAACPRERISEEVLDRIGPPETAPGPLFVVRRICHPSVRRIHPDYPMRCILLPASFTGAPEAFPFSAGKFLLWPSPEEGN